jgi:flagellar hook-length control protein FliK
MKQGPDGNHEITVELRPEGLGQVRIEVSLHAGRIELRLDTEARHTRELMRDAIADLRRELETVGFDSVSVDVGDLADRLPQRNGRSSEQGQRPTADDGWWADANLDTPEGVTNAMPNVVRNTKRSPGAVDVHV